MKKVFSISIITLALVLTFSACTTYEEGPSFSLLTPDMRIKGTWNQTELYINDDLQDNTFKVDFTFESDGTGTRTSTLGSASVTVDIVWQFNDDKTILLTKEPDDTEYDEATILRLTNSEMWIIDDAELWGEWEFRFEKV
ncbi:MAG: hypothetical protein PHE56_16345 [Bacteroidales bacterium]|jgi:hypothetical protein|nr:hypothetical protein [Bacteroidales bacterium]